MYTWLLLVLVFQPASGKSALQAIDGERDERLAEIICNFFKDQPTLRVFNFGATPMILPGHAILSHDQIGFQLLDDMGCDIVDPRTNIGYVVQSEFEFVENNLRDISRINTNGRWLLLIEDPIGADQIVRLLVTAWRTYSMLNILLVHQTTAYFYDPFVSENVQLDLTSQSLDFASFEARTKNVRGFPLRTEAIHQRLGYPQEEIFHMYDIFLEYLLLYVNATPDEVPAMPVVPQVSVKRPNGQFDGAHSRINGSSVEISVVPQVVVTLGRSNVVYLYSTKRFQFFYVVKDQPTSPKIIDLRVWDDFSELLEFSCLSAITLVWFLLEQCRPENFRRRQGFTRVWVDMTCILSGGSIRLFHKEHHSIRIIVWILLFYALILNNAYQGRIITKLSLSQDSKNINNLEELLASNYSLYSGFSSLEFSHDSGSKVMVKLSKRNLHTTDFREIYKFFGSRSDVAFLTTLRAIEYHEARNFDNKTREFKLHRIPDQVLDFLSAFLVRRDSPFLVHFNQAVLQAFETGFQEYADRLFKQKMALLKLRKQLNKFELYRGEKKSKAIKMANLEHVFNTYFSMLGVAVGVFVAEMVWFRARRQLKSTRRLRRINGALDKIGVYF